MERSIIPSEINKKLYKVSGVGLRTYVDNNCSNSILSFSRALNNAGKRGGNTWTEEDEQAYWDEFFDD